MNKGGREYQHPVTRRLVREVNTLAGMGVAYKKMRNMNKEFNFNPFMNLPKKEEWQLSNQVRPGHTDSQTE